MFSYAYAGYETKKYNKVLASPGKSLYISITLGSAIHHPIPPFLLLVFVLLLCWHVTRQDTGQMACLPF